ncbi:hypothetical protein ACIA8O_11735 [Kitasatospora sp. NPDC051853]|uniref:hypothetical protein n=1 Tax=Kitasatospora sp. NPDC051853 TaxID=3364058 RepID=UPI00378E6407
MVEVVQVGVADGDRLAVVVRCLAPTRLGARFHLAGSDGRGVVVVVAEIRRYPQVTVDEVYPPHGARLVLTGAGAGGLRVEPGDVLRGSGPEV